VHPDTRQEDRGRQVGLEEIACQKHDEFFASIMSPYSPSKVGLATRSRNPATSCMKPAISWGIHSEPVSDDYHSAVRSSPDSEAGVPTVPFALRPHV
jgi:hypothetical protein